MVLLIGFDIAQDAETKQNQQTMDELEIGWGRRIRIPIHTNLNTTKLTRTTERVVIEMNRLAPTKSTLLQMSHTLYHK